MIIHHIFLSRITSIENKKENNGCKIFGPHFAHLITAYKDNNLARFDWIINKLLIENESSPTKYQDKLIVKLKKCGFIGKDACNIDIEFRI